MENKKGRHFSMSAF